jgi:hypothetical protein
LPSSNIATVESFWAWVNSMSCDSRMPLILRLVVDQPKNV